MTSLAATAKRVPLASLRELGRTGLIGSVAAMVAGLLAGGIGSRLAMSLVAIADPTAQGLLTANDNVVGKVTLDGTLFLGLFATLVAAFHGGLLYIAYARLLPGPTALRGLLLGVALLCIFGAQIIEPSNRDFVRFASPPWDIGLFAVLFLAFGLIAVGVGAGADRRLPPIDAPLGWAFEVAGIGLIMFWVVIAALVFGLDPDPSLIVTFGGAMGVAALTHLLPGPLTTWIGRAVLIGVSVAGAVGLVGGIIHIFSLDAVRLP
ncbi:MAG: hypothetical protein ACRDGJ_03710 [Candidatus Limnocylindria bacterium]